MISIIVPIYNSEAYLERCIESILSQQFCDYELLLVDDGSSDASGSICDEYARNNPHVLVFHKQNGGVSSARNYGMEHASGEWIYFADSDDMLMPDCLQTLADCTADDVDMVVARHSASNATVTYDGIVSRTKVLKMLLKPAKSNYLGNIGDKMFRRTVIADNAIVFDENIYYGEDRLFITEFLCCSLRSVRIIPYIVYCYTQHPASAMEMLAARYSERYITDIDSCVRSKSLVFDYTTNPFLRYAALWLICESAIRVLSHIMLHAKKCSELEREIILKLKNSGAYWLFLIKYPLKRILHPNYFR